MGSFDQLLSLFSNDLVAPGAWFHIPESEIYVRNSKRFANKDGLRPCLLGSIPGPNTVVYTRSSSLSMGGIEHPFHIHAEGPRKCVITKKGWIVKAPVIVDSSQLVGDNFSCFDPDSDSILADLQRWGGSA